jgi:enoyl-CoA hydratase/carnithine racemase
VLEFRGLNTAQGAARAAELVMTGDVYPAAGMHRWGVVNRILPAAVLREQARAFAARLGSRPLAGARRGSRPPRPARHGSLG